MPNLNDLRETRASRVEEMTRLVTAAEGAGRDLNEQEASRFDALRGEVTGLDTRISRAEAVAEMERRSAAEPVGERRGDRALSGYSLTAAIQGAASGRLSGLEAEMHQELSRGREARSGAGFHLAVPSEILLGETRGQTVGSDPAGGYLVGTQLGAMADRFRPALRTEAMGATVLRGLTGDLDLPNLAASGSAGWVGENEDATRSSTSFAMVSMKPRTVAGEYQLSRRLMLQTGAAIEDILRRDLGFLLAQALDSAAISGAGASGQPQGVLSAGIEKVTTEAALSDTAANLIAALELDDVTGTRAFLTNPTVMAIARKIKDSQGHTISTDEIFHGERIEQTTQVPANIGAGSNKSALIFGQWSELIVGYWSAVDILVNPYHPNVASKGGALLHAFLDADVAVRHLEAFAYAEI